MTLDELEAKARTATPQWLPVIGETRVVTLDAATVLALVDVAKASEDMRCKFGDEYEGRFMVLDDALRALSAVLGSEGR